MATSARIQKVIYTLQRVYKFPTSLVQWKPPPASAGHLGRYLWTDAFGVLNLITLYKITSEPHYLSHATILATTVHEILGRRRDQQSRLPGATATNPLGGGLRIGKEDETGPDGDGQYHHYLTLWMFALNRLAIASGTQQWNDFAINLARARHPHFVYNRDKPRPRMYWKMSVELERPLVPSEGTLDPIDGCVVFRLLQQTDGPSSDVLSSENADYKSIVDTKWESYNSSDPLDLGMTLWTSHWFTHKEDWAEGLVYRARRDLDILYEAKYFERSLSRHLAFRGLGTALGMKCADPLDKQRVVKAD